MFVTSVFTGMAVLVARFAGANEPDKVNRVVYQAFLTAAGLAVVLGALGWMAAPALLDLVNAAPDVQAEALPFLRTMFVGFIGMMMFFMLSGAFRAAGDPHTPLRLGVAMTVLTIAFNVVLIPMFGTVGAAYGTVASSTLGLRCTASGGCCGPNRSFISSGTWIGAPTSRSSGRCSASACRPASRGSR